jgi:hypothetical protein
MALKVQNSNRYRFSAIVHAIAMHYFLNKECTYLTSLGWTVQWVELQLETKADRKNIKRTLTK